MTRVYLTGPMSNLPQFNFPAFDAAAAWLRREGFEVVSPTELDSAATRAACLASPDGKVIPNNETWADLLSRDVKIVADKVDGIVFLPHWVSSRGARLEAYVALLVGKKFFAFYMGDKLIGVQPDFIRNELRSNMP
jgi:hypothetical protein